MGRGCLDSGRFWPAARANCVLLRSAARQAGDPAGGTRHGRRSGVPMMTPPDLGAYWAQPAAASREQP